LGRGLRHRELGGPELGVAAVMFIQMQPAPANVKSEFQQALRKAIVK
jgi:hypothetical protein